MFHQAHQIVRRCSKESNLALPFGRNGSDSEEFWRRFSKNSYEELEDSSIFGQAQYHMNDFIETML